MIVRLLKSPHGTSAPFPWQFLSEEADFAVGQRRHLVYLAPLIAQGVPRTLSAPDIHKFAIVSAPEIASFDGAPACSHAFEIIKLVSFHEGFTEALDLVRCRYDGLKWILL